ncbi:hypothetical protein [Brevundimonas sp.]|uniref:hypothetical protein n=1 Tax=Brevundimonas sp. TaxID=1871086 RepID=UPI002731EE32|nr:hypothetical protein [Brevundimonas sp.]MDP1912385.1 hypothetical protein [Brevundimonas sp.]
MTAPLHEALGRTLLLMRDSLSERVTDDELIDALTQPSVVLAADGDALATHSGQSAFITAALLMARSGHRIHLMAPEAALVGHQPPLAGTSLRRGLTEAGADLLPGRDYSWGPPEGAVDLVVRIGSADPGIESHQTVSMNASDWSATLGPGDNGKHWEAGEWPMGGLAVAALAAGEAFKGAMRRMRRHARAPIAFDVAHAPAKSVSVALAPPQTPLVTTLPDSDLISGGAIANAVLYVLHRLPGVAGRMRVFDHDLSGLSNLNRNMLLLRSRLDRLKVDDLATFGRGLTITPIAERFDEALAAREPLSANVLVGVDDIPTRWLVQRLNPEWLGVGATAGFMAMSSFHENDLPCVGCLHPSATDGDGPIPTAAFVSFWGGLLLTAQFLRHLADDPAGKQQTVAFALRPEGNYDHMVMANPACPVCCAAAQRTANAA